VRWRVGWGWVDAVETRLWVGVGVWSRRQPVEPRLCMVGPLLRTRLRAAGECLGFLPVLSYLGRHTISARLSCPCPPFGRQLLMNPVRYRTKGETGTASKVSDRICQNPPKTGMRIASDPPNVYPWFQKQQTNTPTPSLMQSRFSCFFSL
jgi:hypothetical protein